MSCYFRHLKEVFEQAGIQVTPDNKKKLDKAIHEMVGSQYKDCPAAWKLVKQEISGDEKRRQDFINKLKKISIT